MPMMALRLTRVFFEDFKDCTSVALLTASSLLLAVTSSFTAYFCFVAVDFGNKAVTTIDFFTGVLFCFIIDDLEGVALP